MDPTHPKPCFPSTTTAKNLHRRHPQPDSTIQNISHRFSELYANHKIKPAAAISSPSFKHPEPDITFASYFQPKTKSLIFDGTSPTTTTTTLTDESNSHHEQKRIITTTSTADLQQQAVLAIKFVEKEHHKNFITKTKVKKKEIIKADEEEIKKKKLISSIPPPVQVVDNNGIRKSFCSSSSSQKIEAQLADFFSCAGVKVVAVDMPPFMQIHAVDCARKVHDSLEKFTSKTLALTLKKEFDGVYGPAWHCIVGTSFGSFVTHSVGGFMYFSMDHKLYILLFKTSVQRAQERILMS